ncbi:hypothetical protein [Flavobacterium hiemivividum]|uniref:hypothetical protein n=1 Tax=Flavobacterium hiemivividum TaxID=2541734 RepID=UPI00140474C0|nr:hypothetical protein [Flavobacterium hiemivividum]
MKLEKLNHLEQLSDNLLLIINGGQSKKKKKKKKNSDSIKNDISSDTTDTQKDDSFKK